MVMEQDHMLGIAAADNNGHRRDAPSGAKLLDVARAWGWQVVVLLLNN